MVASMGTFESALKAIQETSERRNARRTSRNRIIGMLGELTGSNLGGPVQSVAGGKGSSQAGAQGQPSGVQAARSQGGSGELDRFINAIVGQESGGNYRAVGIPTKYGRALGRYQIIPGNVGPWSREALGRSVSPQQFLNDPKIQDAVAKHKLSQYYKKYGVEGAAKAWYGGEGAAKRSSNKRYYGGQHPSLNQYAASIRRRMG